ncbi:MAG: 2-oxoacid:acceptor oxidoreductase subunit alpha [Hyphomicrobiales bacterium]|nr:2-oxoacid:acceptor oxidoreductase subunit alpha [Hyphomicrobiales bacterium]
MGGEIQPLHGNHACALAAVAAGCRFFAGYPITPSSEIAERMSRELPPVGGVFIQMEDEIASMAAVIGASLGGAKAMTATSGPGFSLKQENIGLAAMMEAPCVIVDVMRGGPSTGMPTRPAQGDIMQARWGTHGDHPAIVITPASVKEIYEETIRAFNLAEELRVPVIILYDQVIAHLLESFVIPDNSTIELVERKFANGNDDGFLPFAPDEHGVPPMVRPGDGHRIHTTGLTHAETGFPTQDPKTVDRVTRRLLGKIEMNRALIDRVETLETDDADLLIVAFGIGARAARRALRVLREEGLKIGLFRPITMWPFPEDQLRAAAAGAKAVLVPEMNAGQLVLEVERALGRDIKIVSQTKIDGEPIEPPAIIAKAREILAP